MREREYLNSYHPEHFSFVRQSKLHASDFRRERNYRWGEWFVFAVMLVGIVAICVLR